jgi:hypothetical protein
MGRPMLRGAVFIGVDQTKGGLQILRAASSSAKKMYEWAIDPDLGAMDPGAVRLISDSLQRAISSMGPTSSTHYHARARRHGTT